MRRFLNRCNIYGWGDVFALAFYVGMFVFAVWAAIALETCHIQGGGC